MKFGVSTFVTDEGILPGRLGAALEERGLDSLFLAEHSHIPASRESPFPEGGDLPRKYYRTLDPFVALTAAAAATRTLTVGTGVALLPQRDTIHTANEAASLDLVSGGRFVLGVGVGWNREEMRNHGTDPATRGALMNEQLQAIRALWTEEQAEFHGTHVDFDPVYAWPKPVSSPHPPIYVGGESAAALRRTVAYGDGWLPRPHTRPEAIREAQEWFADQGRPDVPMAIFGAPADEKTIEGWAEVGVDHVTFMLETAPEADTLRELDELAAFAQRYNS
ncbi:LLM class F420-dependent oxidoreductase [Prauserella rugosa]|uniref:Putative F420-dependent oxidoreductase n=1 Tax=Prauserella rugosa TaxID=43354 RepID=A0A660CDQ2_9PSEU|nr:LLM class F420-dependent oxidoreductase [Prauserella rugosa]KID28003.1 putative F dependent oxidoreductase [Prauserella sp. Am3]TWH19015.1 putative F420-dependent oxidoreductase [Prauserella rugosa]